MSSGQGSFCIRCGSPFGADQAFCMACGAPRPHAAAPAVLAMRAGQAAAVASRAYGTIAQVTGMAGMGLAVPWQKVFGAGRPDIASFLSAAALPGAQRAIRASLKRPGLAMAVTTVLDVGVAVITGGTSALYKALPRLALGASTSVLSLATGSKGGGLRRLTGIVGAATGAAQLGFVAYTLATGIDEGTSAWVIAPQVVAMTSSLVAAVKTTAVAFRRTR